MMSSSPTHSKISLEYLFLWHIWCCSGAAGFLWAQQRQTVNPQLRNWEKTPEKTNLIGGIFPTATFLRKFFNPSATKHVLLNTLSFISASPRHQKCLGGDLPHGTALAAGQLNTKIRFYDQRAIYCCPKMKFFSWILPARIWYHSLLVSELHCSCEKKENQTGRGENPILSIKRELKS